MMNGTEQKENSYGHVLKYTGVFGGVQGLNILMGLVRNKLVALLLGPAGAGYTELMRRAGCSPAVEACFVRGLASLRKELEAQGFSFPGKTEDPCAFCGYTAAGCNR